MFNGVEIELINAKHFWRQLHKAGFKSINREREAVTKVCKHTLSVITPKKKDDEIHREYTEIFEVKSLAKILNQLGIAEDAPKSTKNFNYEDLSGCGIRIINKLVRELKERKIDDVSSIFEIQTKNIIAGNKSEVIETVKADNFLKA